MLDDSLKTQLKGYLERLRRPVEIVADARPDVVFHAAALKHVALVENNPAEGVLTNVQGTWNVIEAAIAAGWPERPVPASARSRATCGR